MLRNYLRITLRTFSRQKAYSIINVAGLGVGMAAFVLIMLFVRNELSFDRHHAMADRVYQVQLDAAVGGQEVLTSSSPAVMAGAFIDEFPEVVNATRIDDWSRTLVRVGDTQFYEDGFMVADSSVFDLFTIPLIKGDSQTALNRPNTVVIRDEVARKYFGDSDPMGKIIQVDNGDDYEVTGVFRPISRNSHFDPDFIASFLSMDSWDNPVWLDNSYFTYVLLAPDASADALQAKFPAAVRRFLTGQIEQFMGQTYDEAVAAGFRYDWVLQKASDIYLYNRADDQLGRQGDIRYVYILSAIALFILLIACVNFMNLSTARAAGRAREVGLRKVMGSDRGGLIRQFLGESLVMSMVSMVIALGLIVATLPAFNNIAGVDLALIPWTYVALITVALATGLLSGLYPAFFLSGFQPAVVLKGSHSTGSKGAWLRSTLVVFQFGISIVLIVATAVVYKQMRYINTQDVGFNKDQVVVLPIETRDAVERFSEFRSELMTNPDILDAASAGVLPGPDHVHQTTVFRGEQMREDDFFIAAHGQVSDNYVETLGLRMVAGRDFDVDHPSDVENFVVNEAAAAEMGWTPEEAVGKRMVHLDGGPDDTDRWGTILGVVNDAHFSSLRTKVMPLILSHQAFNQRYMPVRIQNTDVAAALDFLEAKWTAYQPGYPFRYFFLDDDYQSFYEQEARLGTIYTSFSILAILIACMGLFGLASFVTIQRTREIGLRKALGANAPGIILLLTKEFTRLVLVACILAIPIAWFAMDNWLAGFAYHTTIGWGVFVVSGALALLIAWVTVAYNSVKAAFLNPVQALRHE